MTDSSNTTVSLTWSLPTLSNTTLETERRHSYNIINDIPNIRGDLDDIQRQDLVIIYLFGYK